MSSEFDLDYSGPNRVFDSSMGESNGIRQKKMDNTKGAATIGAPPQSIL